MTHLQRLTTDYVGHEDRVRLRGECGDGQTVVLWLTQRLLNRLVPALCQWLERVEQPSSPAPAGRPTHSHGLAQQAVQGFAQAHAHAQLRPQTPVQATASAPRWVVVSVQLVSSAQTARLVFMGSGGETATLILSGLQLRQWLGVVRQAYAHGQWPMAVWPAWTQAAAFAHAAGRSAAVLH